MRQADRLGPQGYYISAERKEAIEQGKERRRKAEEKLNRLFELPVGATVYQSPPSKEEEKRFLDLLASH